MDQPTKYTDLYRHPSFWRSNRNEIRSEYKHSDIIDSVITLQFRPFVTIEKPTCGGHYESKTDHKKRQTGIPPTNLVKYRPATGLVRQKTKIN